MNSADDLQSAKATEALLNIEQVKLLDTREREQTEFGMAQLRYQQAAQSSDVAASFLSGGQQLITTTGLGLSLWCVARRALAGTASVGDVFMVQSLVAQLWNPLQFLGYYAREARQALVDLSDARALLAREAFVRESRTPEALPDASVTTPLLEFHGVSFRHCDAARGVDDACIEELAVLHEVSFAIAPGEFVALVGPSGSGKSTVGRLAARLMDVSSGTVRFNGADVRQVRLADLRSRIAVVSQDIVVFNESIRHNLLYARPDAREDDLAAALVDAGLSEAVGSMPEGLETLVGERGLRLSGGERQRLALARALLRRPELFILDEATSALDPESERLIVEALAKRTLPGCPCPAVLAITHQEAMLREADQVIVLRDGCIAEIVESSCETGSTLAALLSPSGVAGQQDT